MNQVKFSVITVTYNAKAVLETTIQNILAQDSANIEHIIIDGGSTDGTLEVIRKYEPHLACWISEPDKGLYDAMNKGLQKATGNYVWFINAGDLIHSPDTVSKMAEGLNPESLPDVIYGETALIDKEGKQVGMRRLKAPERLNWKSFRWGMLVCHQAFLVKREIAPLYDLNYALVADYDWCIKCLKKARDVRNTHLILADFLEDGISSRRRKASLKERFRIMCRYYGWGSTLIFHIWFAFRFYFAKWVRGRV